MDYKKIINYILVASFVVLSMVVISSIKAEPTPEELTREARELHVKAMRGNCALIGRQIYECYQGNKQYCEEKKKTIPAFAKEFGASHEIQCEATDPL